MTDHAVMPLVEYWKSRTGGTRSQAYTAAETKLIPTVRCGRLLLVPVAAADRALGVVEDEKQAA